MKKRKLFLTSLLALPVLVSPLMVNYALKNDSDVSLVDQKLNADTTSSGLINLETDANQNGQVSIPNNYYKQNSINTLSNSNGPILLFDNAQTFGATDWYGNPAWYVHLGTNDGYYSSYWYTTSSSSTIDFNQAGTKVVDWDYNYETDNLYVLTDTNYLIIITSKTGTIVSATKINDTVNKVKIIKFNSTVYLWNSNTTNPKIYTVDSKTGVLSTTQIQNSSWNNKYLIGIVPLDVNYSVGIFSSSSVGETTTTVNLEMKFIDDSLVDLNNSVTNNIISLTNTKASDIYIAGFARTSDFIVFVGNKIYSVSLNKSVITESKFTNLLDSSSNPSLNGFSITNNVNSAFVDKNNQIYFKTDNSEDFNYISISNQFTKVTISTTGNNTVFTANNVNNAQVFPVPMVTANQLISWEYTGYVLSPDDFTGTGFKNSSLLTQKYTTTSRSPMFRIDGTNTASIPSVIQSSNLVANQTALSGFALDNNNATIIADDITGYAFIRVPYIIRGAWYGESQTQSSGYLISRFKYAGVAQVTTWVSQSSFANIFGSYETNQIDETMLKKQATSIISVPQSILSQANNNLDINFIIVSRTPNTGKITLNATISYTNSYGSAISYAMNKTQEYTIAKQAAAYAFMFAGADNNFNKINVTSKSTKELYDTAQTEIKSSSSSATFFSADVISLGANYTDYANTLPSLWQVEGISKFITKNDKYPSNAVIEVLAADDEIGSIIILVSYNNLSNSTPSKFAIKYTGIVNYSTAQVQFAGNNNTNSLYSQKFNDNKIKILTSVQGFADYNTKLASDVTAGALASLYSTQLIQYMGFTPKVSIVNNQDNDKEGYSSLDMEYGSVYLKLDFTDTESSVLFDSKEEKVVFPKILYDKMGLKNGVIYQRYIGMLPIGETYGITINQEKERQLIFANNVNAEFIPSQIRNILDVKGYDVAAGDTINIDGYSWNGEVLIFYVSARSKTYESVRIDHKEFQVNWAPKFANIRQTSLVVAVITSLIGITLVALGISLYIVRRNKIRKLLK